jgi:hypothetical protein
MHGERSFPLIFFDRDVFERSGVGAFRGEPIVVRGEVTHYEKGSYSTLQIVVEDADQLMLPELPSTR